MYRDVDVLADRVIGESSTTTAWASKESAYANTYEYTFPDNLHGLRTPEWNPDSKARRTLLPTLQWPGFIDHLTIAEVKGVTP